MLNNFKTNQRGFTIVELLIVIVVIAILAAISIVAYNGIQNRGKASAGQSLAATIQKKAEAYNSIKGSYPTRAQLIAEDSEAKEAFVSDSNTVITADVNSSTARDGSTVTYKKCATSGAQVVWWDYQKTTGQPTTIPLGTVAGACS